MPIRRSPNGARHVRPQPGRNRPERVVAVNRNAWSQSVGIGGRNHPVRACWEKTVAARRELEAARSCHRGPDDTDRVA